MCVSRVSGAGQLDWIAVPFYLALERYMTDSASSVAYRRRCNPVVDEPVATADRCARNRVVRRPRRTTAVVCGDRTNAGGRWNGRRPNWTGSARKRLARAGSGPIGGERSIRCRPINNRSTTTRPLGLGRGRVRAHEADGLCLGLPTLRVLPG